MLSTGDPSHDPRITWAAQTLSELAATHVLGAVWPAAAEYRTYDDGIYVERFSVAVNASAAALRRYGRLGFLNLSPAVKGYVAREGRPPQSTDEPGAAARVGAFLRSQLEHQKGAAARFVADWAGYYAAIAGAIYRRARSVPVAPDVIVALDLYALPAAEALRRRLGCRLVYDSHELWPYADLLAQPWESHVVGRLEGALLRYADGVITVSPQIARELERMYGLPAVEVVPNAAPVEAGVAPSSARAPSTPVRFLLQGGVAPGRGVDLLLEAWRGVEPSRAVLYLRCPETAYLAALRERFDDLVLSGSVEFLSPVDPSQLVGAATFADVGVIPYVGPNPNHLYCCPNKLSQYMQAGLAILTNDLPFVRSVVERYDVGTTYAAERPASLRQAVGALTGNLERLGAMKTRARDAAVSTYNWASVSGPYASVVERALARRRAA